MRRATRYFGRTHGLDTKTLWQVLGDKGMNVGPLIFGQCLLDCTERLDCTEKIAESKQRRFPKKPCCIIDFHGSPFRPQPLPVTSRESPSFHQVGSAVTCRQPSDVPCNYGGSRLIPPQKFRRGAAVAVEKSICLCRGLYHVRHENSSWRFPLRLASSLNPVRNPTGWTATGNHRDSREVRSLFEGRPRELD